MDEENELKNIISFLSTDDSEGTSLKNIAEEILSLSGSQNLYKMLTIESEFSGCEKKYILKKLCDYGSSVKSIKITVNLLVNIESKLFISFRRLNEMEDSARSKLFDILKKYDTSSFDNYDFKNQLFDESDKQIFDYFVKGDGEHRLKFETDREQNIKRFSEEIDKISTYNEDKKSFIKLLVGNSNHNDKDNIMDAVDMIRKINKINKNNKDDAINRAFIFAYNCFEMQNEKLGDFLNYFKFALALYSKEYKAKVTNNSFIKNKKLRKTKNELYEEVLNKDIAEREWQRYNKVKKIYRDLVLNSHNFNKHQCKVLPKNCHFIIGFDSIPSLMYHFMKHPPSNGPVGYIGMALKFISTKVYCAKEDSTRFCQNGNGRIITLSSNTLNQFLVIVVSDDGNANILTYWPKWK